MKQPLKNRVSRIIAVALLQATLFLASVAPIEFCRVRSPIGYNRPVTTLTHSPLPGRRSTPLHVGRALPFKNYFVCLIPLHQLDFVNRRCDEETKISFAVNLVEVYSFDIISALLKTISLRSLDYDQLRHLKA